MLQVLALWNTLTCEFCLQTMKITHQMTALLLICLTLQVVIALSTNLSPLYKGEVVAIIFNTLGKKARTATFVFLHNRWAVKQF